MTTLTPFLFLHIVGGSLALVGGYAALFAPKGGVLHRRAGMLFFYAMVAMGIGAMIVGLARGKSTWLGGPLVIYLVATGMITVSRTQRTSRTRDIALMMLALVIGLVSLAGGIQIVMDPRGPLGRAPGVASLVNALVLLLCAAGDVRVLRSGPRMGTQRLARHLWRMCYAMFVATGSFFLGQAKVIPEPLRITPLLTVLAFLPLPAMFYWLWRVRRRPHRMITRVPLTASSPKVA
ncbi:MAG: hypothetical protein JWL61_1242 [Gemmatimonadetes bacterium]|jgi:hypothetical protein|nr:hypothetical protein [Gemmatimonadota bacterium]